MTEDWEREWEIMYYSCNINNIKLLLNQKYWHFCVHFFCHLQKTFKANANCKTNNCNWCIITKMKTRTYEILSLTSEYRFIVCVCVRWEQSAEQTNELKSQPNGKICGILWTRMSYVRTRYILCSQLFIQNFNFICCLLFVCVHTEYILFALLFKSNFTSSIFRMENCKLERVSVFFHHWNISTAHFYLINRTKTSLNAECDGIYFNSILINFVALEFHSVSTYILQHHPMGDSIIRG